jgi:hypothetical protein
MHQVRAGRLLEQLDGKVLAGVGAGRAIGEPAGRGLGALDHVANGLRAGRRIGHEDDGDIDQLGHGGELAQQVGPGIAGQIGIEQERSGCADAQRVAIRSGLRDLLQARKASEIVIFTFRTLQSSPPAMLSVFAVGSAMSSSSQRRPRAIDATRIARFSRVACERSVSAKEKLN